MENLFEELNEKTVNIELASSSKRGKVFKLNVEIIIGLEFEKNLYIVADIKNNEIYKYRSLYEATEKYEELI